MKAFVLIETQTGKATAVVKSLKDKRGIASIEMVTGPHDVIAIVKGSTLDIITRTVTRIIQPVSGIKRTTICVAFTLN